MLKQSFAGVKALSLKKIGAVRCIHSTNKSNAGTSDDFIASLLKRMDSVQDSPDLPKDFDTKVDLRILNKTVKNPSMSANKAPTFKASEGRKGKTQDLAFDVTELDETNFNSNQTENKPARFNKSNNDRNQGRSQRRPRPQNRNSKFNANSNKKPDEKNKKIRVNITAESFASKRSIKMQSSEFISTAVYPLQELNLLSLHREQSMISNSCSAKSTVVSYATRVAAENNLPVDSSIPNVSRLNQDGKPITNSSEIVVKNFVNGSTIGDYTKPIVLQHTPYDKNFKFKQDEALLKYMVKGEYPELKALDQSAFVKKFKEKHEVFHKNSEAIRNSLQQHYLNNTDLQTKEQLLKVCSGLAPVSSLFK